MHHFKHLALITAGILCHSHLEIATLMSGTAQLELHKLFQISNSADHTGPSGENITQNLDLKNVPLNFFHSVANASIQKHLYHRASITNRRGQPSTPSPSFPSPEQENIPSLSIFFFHLNSFLGFDCIFMLDLFSPLVLHPIT